jgi:hypothetical protein
MVPSFISAMMSMVNIDYKYFAGSRDPVEIILKYMARGYGVVLNQNERTAYELYVKNIDVCGGAFKPDQTKLFGTKDLNSLIYKQGVWRNNWDPAIYNPSTHRYIGSIDELRDLYTREIGRDIRTAPIDILGYNAIGHTGTIVPVKMWVADAYWDWIDSMGR